MGRLDQKVTIITGAGAGIGRAIALKAAAEGGTVIVTDRDLGTAEQTAGEIGDAATAYPVDVTDKESVDATVAAVTAEHGRIDVLINNAGWDEGMPFLETGPDFWQKVIAINFVGVLNTCHAVLPHMKERGGGSVVNLGSDSGRVGSTGEAVYSGAKGGVIAFSKTIALEMARSQVNVNVVSPGPTDTAFFASMGGESPKLREALTKAIPFRRLGSPDDLANAVVFLASDEASYITGQTLSVSGGLTMT